MGLCLTPWTKETEGHKIDLPCGRCLDCKRNRINGWKIRLEEEMKRSSSCYFITLTYEECPQAPSKLLTLDKTDVQKFFKRLRKRSLAKVKYYAVGEYGSKNNRPHYHILIYNADIEHIRESWTLGFVHCGTVTLSSIEYTLKYISKRGRIPMFEGDDRVPEFSLMSKKLGDNYLSEKMIKWHRTDMNERMYVNRNGKKYTMPRYYKNKIYEDYEREKIGLHFKNKEVERINELSYPQWKEETEQKIRIVKEKCRKNDENRKTTL
jgi:hypothetical protein